MLEWPFLFPPPVSCTPRPPPKKKHTFFPPIELGVSHFIWIPFCAVASVRNFYHKFNLSSKASVSIGNWRKPWTDNTGVITQTNLSSSPWSMLRLRGDKGIPAHGQADGEGEMERGGFCRNSKGRWNDLVENKQGLCADAPRTRRRKHLCSDPSAAHMHSLLHMRDLYKQLPCQTCYYHVICLQFS